MRFKIIKWQSTFEKPLFIVDITKKDFNLWYKEQSRRFKELYDTNSSSIKVFDIDECYELRQMSLQHFECMTDFLYKNPIISNSEDLQNYLNKYNLFILKRYDKNSVVLSNQTILEVNYDLW